MYNRPTFLWHLRCGYLANDILYCTDHCCIFPYWKWINIYEISVLGMNIDKSLMFSPQQTRRPALHCPGSEYKRWELGWFSRSPKWESSAGVCLKTWNKKHFQEGIRPQTIWLWSAVFCRTFWKPVFQILNLPTMTAGVVDRFWPPQRWTKAELLIFPADELICRWLQTWWRGWILAFSRRAFY